MSHRLSIVSLQVAIGVALLAIWQWGYDLNARVPWLVPSILDPYFVSKPSLIWQEFLRLGCLKPNGADWIGLE